jgi:hypothetical protein
MENDQLFVSWGGGRSGARNESSDLIGPALVTEKKCNFSISLGPVGGCKRFAQTFAQTFSASPRVIEKLQKNAFQDCAAN